MAPYDPAFYRTYEDDSSRSAEAFALHVVELVAPDRVIDVGCGIGTWLRAFSDCGVGSLVGVDGDYVELDQLLIPRDRFVPHDLTKPLQLPGALPHAFDLAISMEVGEHLPERYAPLLIRTLTTLAPVVLFSAVIPHQGGTRHVNEQWPNYWAALFEAEGYVTVDCLRPVFWGDPRVAYYYAQNALLFVRQDRFQDFPELAPYVVAASDATLAKVHPRKWAEANDPRRQPLKRVLAALPHALRNAATRRLGRKTQPL